MERPRLGEVGGAQRLPPVVLERRARPRRCRGRRCRGTCRTAACRRRRCAARDAVRRASAGRCADAQPACGVSAANRGESDLTYVHDVARCRRRRAGSCQAGIARAVEALAAPSGSGRRRVGSVPVSVVRILYLPAVKSRGRGASRTRRRAVALARLAVALDAMRVVDGLSRGAARRRRCGEQRTSEAGRGTRPATTTDETARSRVLASATQGTRTIFPSAPGSITASCAVGASASGISRPTSGFSVPLARPATSAAWIDRVGGGRR